MTRSPDPFRPRRGARAVLLSVLATLTVLAVPAGLSVAIAIATAPAAWAHSTLISSSPAADSVLAAPPARIELVFNEQIRDFQPRIAVTVGDHDPVEVTPVVDGTTVSADLTGVPVPDDGAAGSTVGAVAWKVGYRVVSADGHPVTGLVPFSVGDGPAAGSGSPTAGSPTAGSPAAADAGPAVDGGSSALVWIGGAVAIGGALVVALVLFVRRPRPSGPPAGGPSR